jgi:hypothetical protein
MRDSELTLGVLRDISTNNPEYRFKRLYENLYNIDFYIRAYLKLAPHEGNMTKGTDGRTIDGFGLELVESIIQRMKLERFNPKPGRLKYIEKKNGKLRPLGIGNFEDKLVQEVIREILEAIYEPVQGLIPRFQTWKELSYGSQKDKDAGRRDLLGHRRGPDQFLRDDRS